LQITPDFDLYAAARVLPYLHDLGVDWVYLSPLLQAASGSSHGYDVVDPGRVDVSRGGASGLAALSAEAHRLGMGVLVDIVPNHMGVADPSQNRWWWDLLSLGRSSEYARAFDVDWDAFGGRVLVPVLGDDGTAPDTPYPEPALHYELVSWRRGDADLNYRRFFTITTLAGIRVEEPAVFEESHREIARWISGGLVDGLRVDHPDGLRDPRGYLDDLARLTGGVYVVVEKILEPGEALPASWATAGTTGYDALAIIDRVLVDPAGQQPLDALEARLRGSTVSWSDLTHDTKRAVADRSLLAEVRRIARSFVEEGALTPVSKPGERSGHGGFETVGGRSHQPTGWEDAVAELLASFPVYRSYLPEGRENLDQAFAVARSRRPDLAPAFDLLGPVLTDPRQPAALRFQQTSGMVMAKGVEDCAFYRHSRLTSLNEVGGDPSLFAISVEELHAWMAGRQRDWPDAMTTTTTHDTKRSEDTRARITVLAEVPDVWEAALDQLLALAPVPDPGFGSLLWQAVVGAWPASRERLHAYAEKAMREAGEHTSWTDPDPAYEDAVRPAVDAAFDSAEVRTVVDRLVALLDEPGRSNALASKLVALTMPGVPDVYQGTELWDHSLADPDNRRPVDYDDRAALLADGSHPKLRVTSTALRMRRDRPELFTSYSPVPVSGPAAEHVIAFDRGGAVTVVTRLPVGLARRGGWDDTELTLEGGWREVLTDRVVGTRVVEVLRDLPVALLVRDDG
jgi:(1->4)-alpha-D-glucan 1-alpha-D-glucosylmutase